MNVQAIVKRMFHTKPSKIVGVDIGTGSIKMVQIETGSKPVVSCFAVAELPLELSSIEYAPSVSSSPDIAVCALYRFSLMYSALRSSSIFCFTVSSSSAEKLYLSSSSRRSLRSSAFSSDSVFLRLTCFCRSCRVSHADYPRP